jgi:DNA-directed RNA polymerase subunit M/transcription elongation factor TFIIS
MTIFLCPNCDIICTLFDDISKKQIFHHCQECNEKFPAGNIIWTKVYARKKMVNDRKFLTQDPTLPVDNIQKCSNCGNNDNVYIRNPDLSLQYICRQCN